ncbi:hypothetical protein Tco_0827613 [Tanacetum coccineum]
MYPSPSSSVVTMTEFLQFPNFRGCKIITGDPLPDGAVQVTHTTPPTTRLEDVPPKTQEMKVAEQPCQKVLAEKEKNIGKLKRKPRERQMLRREPRKPLGRSVSVKRGLLARRKGKHVLIPLE